MTVHLVQKYITDTPAKQFCKLGDKIIAVILLQTFSLITGICSPFLKFSPGVLKSVC